MLAKTRLLIVGATHLGRGSTREPEHVVAPIVDRLVGWRPDAIAIEALPGDLIVSYLRLGGPFADMQVGGLPHAAACAQAADGLHDWDLWQAREIGADGNRSPEERTIAWCAAYEPYTALLHVHRAHHLPPSVRQALERVETDGSERWRVAGVSAARLGLERLHPFDDHTNWAASANVPDTEYEEFMANLSARAQTHPLVADTDREATEALRQGDMWPLWRRLNAPETVAESEELESGLFLNYGSPESLARQALAGWRARNLLMAGRLRSITGDYPGGRVLAVVGHAHKGPLEAALATDQWDLEIADIAELEAFA